MPSITPYGDGYRCQVYVKGVRDSDTFAKKKDAQIWGAKRESELRNPVKALTSMSFAQAAAKYGAEVSPKKDGTKWELLRLNKFVEYFGHVELRDIDTPEIGAWRDARLLGDAKNKSVAGSTVAREGNLLRNVFTIARQEWKVITHNPFTGVASPDEGEPRWQRWSWQKIKRVLRRLGYVTGQTPTTKNQEVALAFLITLSTSLRAAECLRVSPTTYSKGVVAVRAKGRLRSEVPIPRRGQKHCAKAAFTLKSGSLDTLFRKAKDATMVGDLTFHDGRATALTMLARRVDLLTLSRISQHKDLRKLQIYYRETAQEIAARLTRM